VKNGKKVVVTQTSSTLNLVSHFHDVYTVAAHQAGAGWTALPSKFGQFACVEITYTLRCVGITEFVHGGRAWVQAREGGGAEFMLTFGEKNRQNETSARE